MPTLLNWAALSFRLIVFELKTELNKNHCAIIVLTRVTVLKEAFLFLSHTYKNASSEMVPDAGVCAFKTQFSYMLILRNFDLLLN